MDDPLLENYNVHSRAWDFVYYFRNMSLHYRNKNLMHTFGEDFHYATANTWFKNLDKLINYINAHKEIFNLTVQYSTPSIYLEAINKEGATYPTNEYDFLPYADHDSGYWTGYFTSRTALKGHTKYVGRYLQSVRTYFALLQYYSMSNYIKNNQQAIFSALDTIEQAMGVLQHHDAVAGTEKQFVANDYTF
jgi:lysosomal alpha-mannosidase